MTWHNLIVPDARPVIASTLAGLGVGDYDGHVGIIRIGTYPDIHTEEFIWNDSTERWIGTVEHMVMTTDDAWAIDMSRQPATAFDSVWSRFNGGVGWEIAGHRAKLRTATTLPDATIDFTMDSNHVVADFATTGQFLLRDALVTYTGITPDGGSPTTMGTFTGCTNNAFFNGKACYALYDAIIPYGASNAGDPGGWGASVFPLDRVGDMWTAGFRLQEKMNAWINGSTDLKYMEIAPWYINRNFDEDYDKPALNQPPRTGMLGPGLTLRGPAYDMGGYTKPGDHNKTSERGMEMRFDGWNDWVAATPTKRVLIPVLYGRMEGGAKDNGETYAVSLALRWVSP